MHNWSPPASHVLAAVPATELSGELSGDEGLIIGPGVGWGKGRVI